MAAKGHLDQTLKTLDAEAQALLQTHSALEPLKPLLAPAAAPIARFARAVRNAQHADPIRATDLHAASWRALLSNADLAIETARSAHCRRGPGHRFCLRQLVEVRGRINGLIRAAASYARDENDARGRLDDALDALCPELKAGVAHENARQTTATVAHETEQGTIYLSGDVGVLMPIFHGDGRTETDVALYVGVNIYTAPVDKDVPLAVAGGFRQRFSFTFGISLTDVEDSDETLEGALAGKALIGGVGYRLTDHLRLGTGAVLFRQLDRNPGVTRKALGAAPYLSLSVDLDAAGAMKKIFSKGGSAE